MFRQLTLSLNTAKKTGFWLVLGSYPARIPAGRLAILRLLLVSSVPLGEGLSTSGPLRVSCGSRIFFFCTNTVSTRVTKDLYLTAENKLSSCRHYLASLMNNSTQLYWRLNTLVWHFDQSQYITIVLTTAQVRTFTIKALLLNLWRTSTSKQY